MLDTVLRAKITAIFKEADIEAYIDEIDDASKVINIGSRIVDMYGNTGATIIFSDIELDDAEHFYTVKWRTLAEVDYADIARINTALWDLRSDFYLQKTANLAPIEEEFGISLKLESRKKYSDGTIALDFKCSSKDSKFRTSEFALESFKIDNCYIALINDIDLSRKMGQLIAERIFAVAKCFVD